MKRLSMLCALLMALAAPARAAVITVDSNTTVWTHGNDYDVRGVVTINSYILVMGSVTLFLDDGCQLKAMNGIYVPHGSSLTIKGGPDGTGMLYANPDDYGAAGIGGRSGTSVGNITIEGGTIFAYGGAYSGLRGGSAGIGGGYDGSGGNITAKGTKLGVGIGGGYKGSGGNITIHGGTITAKGDAAGIGGGREGDGENIKITGGTVTANGGFKSAGIGGGSSGGCATGAAAVVAIAAVAMTGRRKR